MRKGTFDGVFGAVPDSYRKGVKDTLRQLPEEDNMTKKLPIRALLIAAMITALLAGTAIAAKFAFTALNAREALPEAEEAVVDIGMEAFESNLVRYQPIDALVDGEHLILTVEATAIHPEKHLIANGWNERASAIDGETVIMPMAGDVTWPEYAKEQGKTLVSAEVGVRINGKVAGGTRSEAFEGEKLLLTFNNDIPAKRDDPSEPLEVQLTGYDREVYSVRLSDYDGNTIGEDDMSEPNETCATLMIVPHVMDSETLRFEGPFLRKYVTVDWVEFERSGVSLRMKIQYMLHKNLPKEVLDAMPEVRFALADPTGLRDYRAYEYDSLDCIAYPANSDKYGDFGSPQAPQTNTYIEETVWPAIKEWPGAFDLNLLYKGIGEWDAPLQFKSSDATANKP